MSKFALIDMQNKDGAKIMQSVRIAKVTIIANI